MIVTVRYMGQLRQKTNQAQETIDTHQGTVAELLRSLSEKNGAPLLASALVFINDEQVDATTPLREGITITLLTPIAGGQR